MPKSVLQPSHVQCERTCEREQINVECFTLSSCVNNVCKTCCTSFWKNTEFYYYYNGRDPCRHAFATCLKHIIGVVSIGNPLWKKPRNKYFLDFFCVDVIIIIIICLELTCRISSEDDTVIIYDANSMVLSSVISC